MTSLFRPASLAVLILSVVSLICRTDQRLEFATPNRHISWHSKRERHLWML